MSMLKSIGYKNLKIHFEEKLNGKFNLVNEFEKDNKRAEKYTYF